MHLSTLVSTPETNFTMGVIKVIEILGNSKTGWEDATANTVKAASKSVRGIRSVNVQNQSAVVDKGKIVEYRVNLKIAFAIE